MNNKITLAFFFGIVVLIGCKKDKGPIQISPYVETVVSYKNDIQPIFDASCNGMGCHDQFEEAGQLNLANGLSYADLVNVTSFAFNPELLVKPHDPANSVLLQKLNGNATYNPQMPLFAPSLPDSVVKKVETWINQGALNN